MSRRRLDSRLDRKRAQRGGSERSSSAAPASRLPALDAAIASAVAKQTGRGWRLDKADRTAQIDATVAVAQAVERAEHVEHPARLLGWL